MIIAPLRAKRPDANNILVQSKADAGESKTCVLCPSSVNKRKDIILRVPAGTNWQAAVIPNIFPTVSLDNAKAYGKQEVVVESSKHDRHFEDLTKEEISKIFEIYSKRTEVLSKLNKIQYVLIFKNSGGKAGATIRHAHSQIFATSFLPPHILDKSSRAMAFRFKYKTCPYCEVVALERRGARFIAESRGVVAFTPYASMHNYEVWIMPKRHLDSIMDLNAEERLGMAELLKKVVGKITDLKMAYNYYFHQIVSDADQHLYLKVTPRGSIWAGVEIGSGLIINPVSPEDAAEYYRT